MNVTISHQPWYPAGPRMQPVSSGPAASRFGMRFEPDIWKQFRQIVRRLAREHIPHVDKRLDLVRLRAGHHAVKNGGCLTAVVAAQEHPIFTADCTGPHHPLAQVIADRQCARTGILLSECWRYPLACCSDQTSNNRNQAMQSQNEIRQTITDTIIDALKNGGLPPWKRPWCNDNNASGLHASLSTGNPYRGINQLLLQCSAMKQGLKSKN